MKADFKSCATRFIAALYLAATLSLGWSADGPLKTPASGTPKIRIAVGGFVPASGSTEAQKQSEIVADLLTVRLSTVEKFETVERQEINAVTRELALGLAQVSKPEDTIRIGALLRTDWLLLSSWLKLDGTNTLVARVVDARTGIIRDLCLLPATDAKPDQLADSIAEFVINSASRAAAKEQRIFLGLGGVENIGVNNLHSDFWKNFRAELEPKFRGTRFATVERTMVDSLLTELRLNLGGFTTTPQSAASAQPAFLLVDGVYQSIHEEESKINLVLRVQEIGGSHKLYSLKETPGQALNAKIIAILEQALQDLRTQKSDPARGAEALVQLKLGKERARILDLDSAESNLGGFSSWSQDPEERDRRMKNITSAMDSFKAALLLDPDNAEAKICLAVCLMDRSIGKTDAGRGYFGEVIASSTNAATVMIARRRLASSYLHGDTDAQALDMFLALHRDSTHPAERAWALGQTQPPLQRLHKAGKISTQKYLEYRDQQFLAECESALVADSNITVLFLWTETQNLFEQFVWVFGSDQKAGETYVEKVLVQATEKYPRLSPYFWASYAIWIGNHQATLSTNALARLETALKLCRDHPDQVHLVDSLYISHFFPLLQWAVSRKQFTIGELICDIRRRDMGRHASEADYIAAIWQSSKQDTARKLYYSGYCKRGLQMWREAATEFAQIESDSDPFITEVAGPWGEAGTRVSAKQLLIECQQKLGVATNLASETHAPSSFKLGAPVLTLRQPSVFACDGDQIWLADGPAPYVFHKREQKLTKLEWPSGINPQVNAIRVSPNTIWWGTLTNGLVDMDKKTRQGRVLKEENGLLTAGIAAMTLDGEKLWLGFGFERFGGVGYLNVDTRRFTSLTPELNLRSVTNRSFFDSEKLEAPRCEVRAVCPMPSGDLFLLSDDWAFRHYVAAGNSWHINRHPMFMHGNVLVARSNLVAVAGDDGVAIYDVTTRKLQPVDFTDWLKNPNTFNGRPFPLSGESLALDGKNLWIGGEGFLALVDIETGRVSKLCDFDRIRRQKVHCMQVADGELWFAIENRLYCLREPYALGMLGKN